LYAARPALVPPGDFPIDNLGVEVEVITRIFNSECFQMARLSYSAAVPRATGSVSRSTTQPWINRRRGALDSSKEGEAP
jgi:hypothetical protein